MLRWFIVFISLTLFHPTFVSSDPDDHHFILEALTSSLQEESIDYPDDVETIGDSEYIPKVSTTLGLIKGVNLKEAHGFYRIPFAEAPAGNTRFEHSRPIERYSDEINATIIGTYSCMQTGCSRESCPERMTEDCLFLNIHVPKSVDLSNTSIPSSDRLPVIFWIHGGALQTGSGTSSLRDGRYLSNLTSSVVVTINYRLGTFGFLAVKDGDDVICNQGLGDQQLALQWVQDHIEVFGGDKNRVTISGSSAGAQSVMIHLMSQKSAPLFHRAVMQSNPAVISYPDVESALNTTDRLLENTNCTSEGIQCLRDMDPFKLVGQGLRIQGQNLRIPDLFGIIEPFRFVIDGVEFKENPIQFVQNGGLNGDKQVIIGTDIDEMIYVPAYIPDGLPVTKNLYEGVLKFLLGDDLGQAVATKYDEINPRPKDYAFILGEIATDGFFICPSRALARLASKSSDVYLYSFAHAMDDPSCEESWSPSGICGYVFHSSENPFVFRTDPLITYNFSANDLLSADQFTYYWGNFAAAGNPSSGDVTSVGEFREWPKYKSMASFKKVILPMLENPSGVREVESWVNNVIDSPEGQLDENYKEDICDFWDDTKYYVNLDDSGGSTASPIKTTATSISPDTQATQSATTTTTRLEETTSGANVNKLCGVLLVVMLCLKLIISV